MPPGAAKAFKTTVLNGLRGYGKGMTAWSRLVLRMNSAFFSKIFSPNSLAATKRSAGFCPRWYGNTARVTRRRSSGPSRGCSSGDPAVPCWKRPRFLQRWEPHDAGYVYNAVRTALQSVRRRYGWTKGQREATEEVADLDLLLCNVEIEAQEHARIMVREVLALAEPAFGVLLWKVYAEGVRQEVALADARISRATFDRRRRAIAKSLSTLGWCA